ncbi:DUF305 domain-containing protein [Burkholderia stagnalis]|uniref:CopM family metallochaperone n=1 Tax=Burkholderia stagnalis TaxID=1503054 RepID=UPI00075E8C15|nr:DUF305 domain-containing protein [Burkholderia stagnalis]AOK54943.1 DUF305 domain-containing protein [Burkholderia stagnalis]KVN80237.1 DUF305 domain-containing protein [Burkholderia stagnalis]KWO28277.1 DUF305 domain-containing protein [Burkholderia stagnalis]KWO30831.1 DUF305 domain-containing protein [Burkholderia stagnalis]
MPAFRLSTRCVICTCACAITAALAATLALPAAAQLRPSAPAVASMADVPAQAFRRADRRMMDAMDAMDAAPYTGDVDRDFVAHMAPHHQGAIDMAHVELKYGKDPALRRLANRIVAMQRDEIAQMARWQKQQGSR